MLMNLEKKIMELNLDLMEEDDEYVVYDFFLVN
jgi:hypothetical protein